MFLRAIVAIAGLAYPFIVWWGIQWGGLAFLAFILLAITGLRWATQRTKATALVFGISAILAALALWQNALMPLKLYPVIMNIVMLVAFAQSLWAKECMIEKFARIKEPDLPKEAVEYCRRVTKIWCGFFVANGTAALYTTTAMTEQAWVLYNGFIAYILIAALLVGEWLYRTFFLKRHDD